MSIEITKEGRKLTRREMLKLLGVGLAGATVGPLVAGCVPARPVEETTPVEAPAVVKPTKVTIGVGGWAVDPTKEALEKLEFTKQTGIEAEVIARPGIFGEFVTQMTSAIQAGTSPYDVLNFEDEIATTGPPAGWFLPLDDLLPSGFWDDFPQSMLDIKEVWSTYKGETFRVHHNFEACYWWYRKDWFDAKGVKVPTTWDEVKPLGEVFTDEPKGVWASEEGMTKGGMLNVYLAWITRQAGGSPFDVDDKFRMALEYIHDLMYVSKVLNPASLAKDYDAQNADYTADRVAFMRQWPFFYDITRGKKEWYQEGKAEVALPPVGPGGKAGSTYAAGWGFGIIKTAPNLEAAKELFKFLVDKNNAAEMAKMSVWFLSARKSVLDAVGDEGIAKYLGMYSDAGIIGTRPYHPKFTEALGIVEDAASSFLVRELTLDEAMQQAKARMAEL